MNLSSLFIRRSNSPRRLRSRTGHGLEVLETRIAPAAIITGSLTDNTASAVLPGDTIHYTEVVSNTGDSSALNLQISHLVNNANFVAGSLNISPLAGDDAFTAIGNTTLVVGGAAPATPAKVLAGNLFTNDTEFANDLGSLDTFTLLSFTATSANGGTVSVNSDGSFTYLPAAGFAGTDTFTYTITDDGVTGLGAANSGALTSTATVTITVAEKVWYVDASAAPGGTGRSNSPFNSITAGNLNGASDLDGPNDYLYFYAGTYTGGLALEAGQHLIGEGSNLVVSGVTLKTAGTRPTFSHTTGSTITLASGNEVRGLNVTNSGGSGITGSGVGTLAMGDFDVTVTGGSALSVTTSGTITVSGSDNDLNSTNGTALNVANVTIGAGGIVFKSINSGVGANNGIVLDTTGALGGLTVTGTGAAGSGGTISGKTGGDGSTTSGTGIYLNSTKSVSLAWMNIQGNQNYGIRGINVTGFTLDNSTVGTTTANGTSNTADLDAANYQGEGSVRFFNLLGTATISNSTLDNGFSKTLAVVNNTGTLTNLAITNSVLKNSLTAATASDALYLEAEGAGTVANLTISGGTQFTAFRQNAIQTNAQTGAAMNIVISGITIKNTNTAYVNASNAMVFNGTGTNTFVTFDISGSSFTHGDGATVGATNPGRILTAGMINGAGTFYGKIRTSTFGTSGVARSGSGPAADAIGLFAGGNNGTNGGSRFLIEDSTIQQYGQAGIQVGAVDGNATIDATIQGNIIRQPGTIAGGAFAGIWAYAGNNAGDTNVLNVVIGSAGTAADKNTLTDSDPNNSFDVFLGNTAVATAPINLYRNGSGAGTVLNASEAQVNVVLNADNTGPLDLAGNTVSPINLKDGVPTLPPLLFAPLAGEVVLPTDVATPAIDPIVQPPAIVDDGILSQSELDSLVIAAISRWEATGLSAEQSALLHSVTFEVANLGPRVLGQAGAGHVTLDNDGSGNGWFVDATPLDDSEFANSSGIVASRVDAMTTVMHELGHTLGLDDSYASSDSQSIMYGFLTLGSRRAPVAHQADGAVPSGNATTEFAFSPYTIGTLPAGKSVTLNFAATVPSNTTATSVSTQGTISGTNFATVLTNDPDTAPANDATVTAINLPDVTVAVSPGSVNEDGVGTLVYTFTRTGLNDFARTVNFAASGTALFGTAGADYTLAGGTFDTSTGLGTVTFAANSATATITLSATDDTTVEADESAILTVTAGTGYDVGTTPTATGTILNDDTSVAVTVAPSSVTEDGAGNLVYTFTRAGLTTGATTANFSITGPGTLTSADYSVLAAAGITFNAGTAAGTVAFAANETVKTVTVDPTVDTVVEADENVVATVTAGTGYTIAGIPATGTITNDDTDVTLAISPSSVAEDGAANLVYTFTRTGVTAGALTVNFSVGGTATFSTDYTQAGAASFTATTGTVTFGAGSATATVTIDPTVDATAEPDETTLLTLTAGAGYNAVTAGAVTGTIIDDDTSVTLAIAPASVTEDGAGTMVYTFTRTGNTAASLTVNFTVGGTAAFSTDYTQTGAATFNATTGTVTFGAGSATATVTLDPTADATVEADETTLLTLAAGAGYGIGTAGAVSGTITNDDTDISVAVAPASVAEDGAGNLVYTFTRAGVTTGALTANFSVGGTAAFGTDYTQTGAATFAATTGTVTFAAGATTATVTIDPTADTTVEGDETALLTVTAGTGYNVSGSAATGTIANDDTDVTLAILPASVTEDGAANLVYTFTRTGVTAGALTVNFTVGGTATFATDYTQAGAASFNATTGTVTFAAGSATATVTLDPTADTTVEANETTLLTLAAGTGYTAVTAGAVTGTITNDDTDVTLAVLPASVSEDGATNLVYTFTRTGVTAGALTVNFNVGGTATFATDYAQTGAATFTTTTGTVTFAAGATTATVTLDPTADTTVEADETALLTLAAGAGYTAATAGAVSGTITNDDTDISVAVAPASVTEDGAGNLVYTFTRAGVTTGALTANFSVGGTATFATDYTQTGAASFSATTGTVTFAAGATTATVTIDPTADAAVEIDETALLTVTAGAGYNIAGTAATGTIANDDTDVTFAILPASVSEDGAPNLVYTFTRAGVTASALTVNFSVGGTATFNTDYTQAGAATFAAAAGTVTFAAGATTATVTLNPTADSTVEADETTLLTLTAGSYNIATAGAVAGTITNDDTDVTLAVAPASVSEDGAPNLVYTFTRTGVTAGALTVNFSVGGTATFNTDYTQAGATTFAAAAGTVTFAAGSATATVTLDPSADTTVEADETTVLTMTAGAGYTALDIPATGTITSDDTDIAVTVAPASLSEDGAGFLVYTFTRTGVTTGALIANYSLGGTATFFGADFGVTVSGSSTYNVATSTGTVLFAAGGTSVNITVDPTADANTEADETAIMTVTAGAGYNIAGTAATGTITNDDATVSVAVSPASVTEDGAANLVYTFTRTGLLTSALTVDFTVGGSATFNTDYTQTGAATFAAAAGTVTFAANSATATITIDPTADIVAESDETAVLTLAASGTGYTSANPTVATGTISNDDTVVTLAIAPSTVTEDGAATLVYTFTRTGPTTSALTVNFDVAGTAAFGSDYGQTGAATFAASAGTVTIPAGSATATVTLDPAVDTTVEADETTLLTLAAGAGYGIGTAAAVTGTITNDDTDISVAVAPSSVAEDGVGNLVYTFTRTGVTTGAVTVNFSITGPGTLTSSDYSVLSGADVTFNAGAATGTVAFAANETTKTVTVDPTADTFVEADEAVVATVTSGTGYNVAGTPATGTIVNDDTDVSLALSPTSVSEDGATNLVYTFTRAGVTSGSLTVNFIINANAVSPMATLNVDYTASGADVFLATGGTVTFAPGATTATVTLDPIADTTVESDEGVVLELAAGAGYTPITFTQLTAVITNDDTDVTVSVAPASVLEDNAGTLVYTFTRTGVTTGELTVNFDVAGTATFATDYTQSGAATFGATAGTVTFLAGGTTATVSLTSVVDSTVEADETAQLTLTSGAGYNVPSSSATGTITNDDTDIAVSLMQASVKEDGSDNLVFTFTRTGVTTGAVTAGFTLSGTASFAGIDFGLFAPSPAVTFNATTGVGTVTFATGETTVQVTIDPLVDSTLEPDETAIVTLTPGSGYDIAGTAATGTIETDDVDLRVSVADNGQSVIRGGQVTYTITYSNVGNLGVNDAFITQTVPANTFFSSGASTAGWTFIGSNTYSLNVGNLAAGGPEGTATFTVYLFPVIPGGYNALSTTSTISSLTKDVTEATPADNTSTDTTTIYQGIYVVSPGVSLPGRGAPPAIRVFDIATGTETSINAYEPTYRKSIRVATGDINGDGYDDIITSTITGNGRVRVFDGRTGAPMTGAFAELAAFPEAGARGAYVASGDVNGDGRDDIVVGSGYKAKGSAKVRVFSGFDGSVLSTNEPFGTKFHGGVRVAVGDGESGVRERDIVPRGGVISRGVAEIIASQGYGGNRVVVTSGISNTVLKDFTVGGASYKGGVFVAAAADLTGDGIVDFIVGRDRGRTVVETFNGATGSLLSTITPFATRYALGARVAAADVNLDGIADIIVGSGGRNAGSVKFFDGVTNAEMTARTFSAFPTFPNGAVFVAGTSPVPHPQLT